MSDITPDWQEVFDDGVEAIRETLLEIYWKIYPLRVTYMIFRGFKNG